MERKAVRIAENGPMLIDGPVDITMPDGSCVRSDRFVVAICMCRRSKSYPLCDTSHRQRCRSD
ncbi:CDGSH iron-sulfur domain-containing protein [Antrihabitans cavernicola]|uniref:CDGSH iron-sulfur domain-containing protein n=1 Tax=Antrihabitans cavernicola TaxID=2495913 RepID=A0A5A7SB81_9NOCA|nr:CDGSH iron-sulfur domain-containing protein [Spelaeibacter cavernicola]KAA0022107.1 CDGSH iron-sulfur domain-containing protein [Spelaeibacter cavernicola]